MKIHDFRKIPLQTYDTNIWVNQLEEEFSVDNQKQKFLLESQEDLINFSWKIISKHATRVFSRYGVNLDLDKVAPGTEIVDIDRNTGRAIPRKFFEETEQQCVYPNDLE